MDDAVDYPDLDFDPLDDTKVWPENDFPLRHVGRMVLDRNVSNFFAENEQIAFGTGVLVDGLDFSDDKMLVGRTFSYSDTQRYRVGPNYLQLPVNSPKGVKHPVATNQRDAPMAYHVDDDGGTNPHVNYEPSITGGPVEAPRPSHDAQGPVYKEQVMRRRIPLTADYQQAGERYLLQEDWERDELVKNWVDNLSQCDRRDPGAHRLAPVHVRGRVRRARRRGPRHHRRRRPRPRAAGDADPVRRGAGARRATSATTARATSPGSR